MVREESMKELKQRQQRLQERTLWLKEQEESVMRKTRLCMLVMAGIFFLLVMVYGHTAGISGERAAAEPVWEMDTDPDSRDHQRGAEGQ